MELLAFLPPTNTRACTCLLSIRPSQQPLDPHQDALIQFHRLMRLNSVHFHRHRRARSRRRRYFNNAIFHLLSTYALCRPLLHAYAGERVTFKVSFVVLTSTIKFSASPSTSSLLLRLSPPFQRVFSTSISINIKNYVISRNAEFI